MKTTDGGLESVEISVVVPAYNESPRIRMTLSRVAYYLATQHPSSEVIVVDDGSTDDTASIVADIAREESRVRLLRQPENLGKGAAVRRGVLAATGRQILYTDADLATPIEELDKLLHHAQQNCDVAVGSRCLPESDIRVRQPLYREMMGRGFNLLVRLLGLAEMRDTQCGFKLFSRAAAHELFAEQRVDGFAFDVEILMLAKRLGFRIREVPVVWRHVDFSKVSPVTDATRMFVALIGLRLKPRGRLRR